MDPGQSSGDPDRHVVEIGWMLAGQMGETDRQAALRTREQLLSFLTAVLPEFRWKVPVTRHGAFLQKTREKPIRLFDFAAMERDLRNWDFAFVITEAELTGYEKAFPLAAFSTALGAAVISTGQIDPRTKHEELSDEESAARMAHRIEALALHCLGHLIGLEHEENLPNCMFNFQQVDDLDDAQHFSQQQIEAMRQAIQEIADRRLEEHPEWQRASRLSFYLRAALVNRREILQSIARAKPWLFPIRLSRLAAAALSALVILVMTAESWELGMSLSPQVATVVAAVCVVSTTAYVIARQRLLVRREQWGAREQKVIANVSVPAIVLLGMTTTFLALFALTLLVGLTVFTRPVVESWAASVEHIGLAQYLCLSAYVASVALIVGALGASFEDQQYFRHVTFVDEEV